MAGISQLRKGYYIDRNVRTFHVIFSILSGSGIIETISEEKKGSPTRLTTKMIPGNVYLVPAMLPYKMFLEGEKMNAFWFHLRKEFLPLDPNISEPQQREEHSQKQLLFVMEEILSEWDKTAATNSREGSATMSHLVSLLVLYLTEEISLWQSSNSEGDYSTIKKLSAFLSLIAKEPEKKWDTETMAAELELSRRHLTRLFQKIYKTEPGKMIKRIRMERAKEYLQSNEYTLETIAEKTGFSTPYALSHSFKKLTGMSPAEWRKLGQFL